MNVAVDYPKRNEAFHQAAEDQQALIESSMQMKVTKPSVTSAVPVQRSRR
jgi:hypothetical protein